MIDKEIIGDFGMQDLTIDDFLAPTAGLCRAFLGLFSAFAPLGTSLNKKFPPVGSITASTNKNPKKNC